MAADPRKKPQPARGANKARSPWREQAESYFTHHRKVAEDSARRLWRNPVASLMTWTVMGVALALPVAPLLLFTTHQGVSAGWESSARVTAYIELTVPLERARGLSSDIASDGRVAGVELVDRDQALEEFRASSGLEDALDYLEDNPLPHNLLTTPEHRAPPTARVHGTVRLIQGLEGAARAQVDLR